MNHLTELHCESSASYRGPLTISPPEYLFLSFQVFKKNHISWPQNILLYDVNKETSFKQMLIDVFLTDRKIIKLE